MELLLKSNKTNQRLVDEIKIRVKKWNEITSIGSSNENEAKKNVFLVKLCEVLMDLLIESLEFEEANQIACDYLLKAYE
jgi:hypothetical protein